MSTFAHFPKTARLKILTQYHIKQMWFSILLYVNILKINDIYINPFSFRGNISQVQSKNNHEISKSYISHFSQRAVDGRRVCFDQSPIYISFNPFKWIRVEQFLKSPQNNEIFLFFHFFRKSTSLPLMISTQVNTSGQKHSFYQMTLI